MNRDCFARLFSGLFSLLLIWPIQLAAQNSGPPVATRVAPNAVKQAAAASSRDVQQRCGELLKPIEGLKHLRTVARRAEADKIWDSFFEANSDAELIDAEIELRDCLVEPPSLALRRDALQAYLALRDEQDMRQTRSTDKTWGEVMDQEKEKEQALMAEINKKQSSLDDAKAAFAEAANFAVTLYKQRQQYEEAYVDEVRAYGRLSDLTDQVLTLAKQAVYRSSGPSWETLVNPPKPQIIRIETPAVPRSLYCRSSTTPPAAPVLATWTWTNCQW